MTRQNVWLQLFSKEHALALVMELNKQGVEKEGRLSNINAKLYNSAYQCLEFAIHVFLNSHLPLLNNLNNLLVNHLFELVFHTILSLTVATLHS